MEKAQLRPNQQTRIDGTQNVICSFAQISGLIKTVTVAADQDLLLQGENELKKGLQSLKVSEREWKRQYLKGGGKAPLPANTGTWPFSQGRAERALTCELIRDSRMRC